MSILERIRPSVCAVRLIASVQADFKAKKGDVKYRSYVPDGPPPLPKD